jgi:L-fucose isomerase-like protein
MDAIYQNFIKQVAGIDKEWTDGYTLKDQVDRIIRNERFDKEIAALRKKMKSENQFNRQVELHEEIKKLLKERGEKNDK